MANKKAAAQESSTGRFAYEGLNRTIHEKARLGIMASLAAQPDGVLFTELKQLCALTDGNLNRHLQVLLQAGFVELWKGTQNRRPQTLCRLTKQGRQELLDYLAVLEGVVADAAAARRASSATNRPANGAPRLGFSGV